MAQARPLSGSTKQAALQKNHTSQITATRTLPTSAQTEKEFNRLISDVSHCRNNKLKAEIWYVIALTFKKADQSILNTNYVRNALKRNGCINEDFKPYCRRRMVEYLEKASRRGHTNALFELGNYYMEEPNGIDTALAHYETAANRTPTHTEAAYKAGCLYEQHKGTVSFFTTHKEKALDFFKMAATAIPSHPIAAAKVARVHEALIGFLSWTDHRTEAIRYEAIAYQALNNYETAVHQERISPQQFAKLKEEAILILGREKTTELWKLPRPLTAIAIGDMYMDKVYSAQNGSNEYTERLKKANRYYEIAFALSEPYASEKLQTSRQLLTKEHLEDGHAINPKNWRASSIPLQDTL